METFLNALQKYAPVSGEEGKYFYSFFERREYKKNVVLLEEGQVAHEVFFVLRGVLRQFFFNEKGIEKTCNFAFEHEFLTPFRKRTMLATKT